MHRLAFFFVNVSARKKPLCYNQRVNEYESWFHFIQLIVNYSGADEFLTEDQCAQKQHTMNICTGRSLVVRVHVILCGHFCARTTITT